MGALMDMLVRARLRYLTDGGDVLDVLQAETTADGMVADALDILDGCTPHPWTFQLYAAGAYWTPEGDVAYRQSREKREVLAVFGRACVRAARMEGEAA